MKLIVNADDFGWNKNINTGIIESHKKGIVSSTTILANFPGFDDAIKRLPKTLGLGIHLNLTCGKPLTNGKTIQKNNSFSNNIFQKATLRKLNFEDVKEEFSMQIQKVLDCGLKPTHLDGHRHVHVFPVVRNAFVEIAKEFKIDKARLPLEPGNDFTVAGAKNILVRNMAIPTRRLFTKNKIKFPEKFFGICHTGKLTPSVLAKEIKKDYSTKEIMCHPGYNEDEMNNFLSNLREQEMKAVTHLGLKNFIEHYKIKIINFKGL